MRTTSVADSGPLRYLILIGEAAILPKIVGTVLVPFEVWAELGRPQTPAQVQAWIAAPPSWLKVRAEPIASDQGLMQLDPGERAAIALAGMIGADVLLMGDRAGVAAARARGFAVVGTLGLLDRAARRGLIDLTAAFAQLRATNFRYPPALLDTLLAAHSARLTGQESAMRHNVVGPHVIARATLGQE